MPRFDRSRLLDPRLDSPTLALRALAIELAEAALAAVDAEVSTAHALARLEARGFAIEGSVVFAFGKAARPMARAVTRAERGIVIAPERGLLEPFVVHRGGHPDPDPNAAEAGEEVLALARSLGPTDRALVLASGGGSAMLEAPRKGVSVEEVGAIARALMHAGADIGELNAVRQRLSRIKGGGLARAIAPAACATVVLSDVVGPPALVASGPTCRPDGRDPLAILARRSVAIAPPIARLLASPLPPVHEGPLEVAADNATARRAVIARARTAGLALTELPPIVGEARAVGAELARRSGRAFVAGGETTVTVRGAGRGGRNQELVLGALAAGYDGGLLLSFGTDGVDGTSDAAGALIDPVAIADARARGLDPEAALDANDAHAFFDALGTALRCGSTGTNVADVVIALRATDAR